MGVTNPLAILYDVNGNPIGVPTNPLAVQTSGSVSISGNISAVGPVQSGSTTTGFPQLVGGADSGGILRGFLTDTSGKLFVTAQGLSVYTQGIQGVSGTVGVSGGVSVFTQGAQQVTGSVAVYTQGAQQVSGSVSITGGVSVFTQGAQQVSGTVTVVGQNQSGSTATGNPVLIAGADSGGIVRGLLTDASGRQVVVGPVLSGSTANNAAPVIIGGVDPLGVVRTLRTTPAGYLASDPVANTSTTLSVASSTTNVTLLAANVNRIGATIFNDSNQTLYVKLGATASNTSYTVQLTARGYYEIPFGYVGQIDGLWNSTNGAARVTELT
jgi:hypothetical protein